MPEYGLTDKGLVLPRYDELLEIMIDSYEADTGLTVDRTPGSPIYTFFTIQAKICDETAQMVQDVHDSRDPDSATGHSLDMICALTGIRRQPATTSTVTLELTGDPNVIVPAGRIVEDTGERQRWLTLEKVTLANQGDGTGFAEVMAEADKTGPINAEAEAISKIITPVSGWEGVTNPEAATRGSHQETDSELRQRRDLSLQIQGGSSRTAIRGRLLALEFVQSAEVFHNDTPEPKTVAGVVDAPPHSVVAYLFATTENGELTNSDHKSRVAEVLFRSIAAGVVTAGNDETVTVVTSDGVQTPIHWSYADIIDVNVTVQIDGASPLEVQSEVKDAVEDYFDGLLVGDDVLRLPILGRIAEIPGIRSATVLLDDAEDDIGMEDYQVARVETENISVESV